MCENQDPYIIWNKESDFIHRQDKQGKHMGSLLGRRYHMELQDYITMRITIDTNIAKVRDEVMGAP